jgi:Protein of unknown function (DUF3551)
MMLKLILTLALSVGLFAPLAVRSAAAQETSYPWCVQGGMLRCYYMSREQCEQTVDYHGFCVANPEYRGSEKQRR